MPTHILSSSSSAIAETANRVRDKQNYKKKKNEKKEERKKSRSYALKLHPVWRANAHPENLKLLSHWEKKEEDWKRRHPNESWTIGIYGIRT